MNRNVYQHFLKEEYTFIDKVLEWKQRVEETYIPFVTPFLNPREQHIVRFLFSEQEAIFCFFEGGYSNCERKRALITRDVSPLFEAFQLTIFQLRYPKKFAKLKHSAILGSLLALGIKRDYIGDIVTNGSDWQLAIASHLEVFVADSLKKVGNITVVLEQINPENSIQPKIEAIQKQDTVSSLRLDVLLACGFGLSRQEVKSLIEAGKAFKNWKKEQDASTTIAVYDVLTLRQFGRMLLTEIGEQTKSGKWRIKFDVLKSKK